MTSDELAALRARHDGWDGNPGGRRGGRWVEKRGISPFDRQAARSMPRPTRAELREYERMQRTPGWLQFVYAPWFPWAKRAAIATAILLPLIAFVVWALAHVIIVFLAAALVAVLFVAGPHHSGRRARTRGSARRHR